MIHGIDSGWASAQEIVFYAKGNSVMCRFMIERAATREEQERGLMFRRHLAEGTGMLFLFEGEAYRTFWMKNTVISLDIIFLNGSWKVVDVYPFAQPLSEKNITSKFPAQYVLEVNAGEADRCGIQIGTKAKYYP